MMVIFVSQCEKNALSKTRRVLDAFADRIGDNTWRTVITLEGLDAVKKLLRQKASKSTAVSCHWIRSRSRSDLLWVVGNKRMFGDNGVVAVNRTGMEIADFLDKNKWKTLPVIKYAAAISGLFHDFGKATVLFQNKINPNIKTDVFEPFRHEWVSLRLFQAFVKDKTDAQWLDDLSNGIINIKDYCKDDINKKNNPFTTLPQFAKLIAWLLLSHHRLPKYPNSWEGDFNNAPEFDCVDRWLSENFCAIWNSPKSADPNQKNRIPDNWKIVDNGLPYNSCQWKSKACLIATEAKKFLSDDVLNKDWMNELFTSHISRMVLMMSDHYFSSLSYNETQQQGKRSSVYPVYANTYWDDGIKKYKQQLDEHLIGVADNSENIASQLPKFLYELEGLPKKDFLEEDVLKALKNSIKDKEKVDALYKKFSWQDDARSKVQKIATDTLKNGFFGINMASTGCGKTIANAKIIYAIGRETGKVRFNVALGLRTLTLQTGREFQKSLNLNDDELAIAIGGIAIKALFEHNQRADIVKDGKGNNDDIDNNSSGSASEEGGLNDNLNLSYLGKLREHALSKWTSVKGKEKTEQLIQPAVLVCTIDHLMPATEGIKSGWQIAPMLRLLSSDLILDEPDDFGLDDLPALCRLVHCTAMLGSRVLLSTATMPPAFVYACFKAYKAGWSEYAKANIENWDGEIQCAWFDERGKSEENKIVEFKKFREQHNRFVDARIAFLEKVPPKRISEIVDISQSNDKNYIQNFAERIYTSIYDLHKNHYVSSDDHKYKVSIGLVRMANIDPMIAVAKELITMDSPDDTCIHYCVYHSRFPLAIRSYIENKLDNVLQRKNPKKLWDEKNGIGSIIKNSNYTNHIFVVIASPVAEVGRDHDYDWAVVEPSSMRSIVQLAGRVLRHRDVYPKIANIHLLNKNIKGLKGMEICFEKPGFESKEYKFILEKVGRDMNNWLDENEYKSISSIAKVKLPEKCRIDSEKYINLSELEHLAILKQLFGAYRKIDCKNNEVLRKNGSASSWWKENVSWCGEIQRRQQFRKPECKEVTLCRYLESELHDINWQEQFINRNKVVYEKISSISLSTTEEVVLAKNIKFWIILDEEKIYNELMNSFKQDMDTISKLFGNVSVPIYSSNVEQVYCYYKQFGIFKEIVNDE